MSAVRHFGRPSVFRYVSVRPTHQVVAVSCSFTVFSPSLVITVQVWVLILLIIFPPFLSIFPEALYGPLTLHQKGKKNLFGDRAPVRTANLCRTIVYYPASDFYRRRHSAIRAAR